MKKILLAFLLLSGFNSFSKDKKDKPEPSFKKGTITATAAYGFPLFSKLHRSWIESTNTFWLVTDYQVSRGFNAGAKYVYYYEASKVHFYKSFGGVQMQRKSRDQLNLFMATANYCYLNRGRISLSTGIGLGFGYRKYAVNIIDSNGKPYNYQYDDKGIAIDIRLIEAKVMLRNNFALYGSFGIRQYSVLALGASYNFLAYAPPAKKSKRDRPEPAFSKGAISLIATYGTLSVFAAKHNTSTEYPGNLGVDAQYQLSRSFNAGLHYGYLTWVSTTRYVYAGTNILSAHGKTTIHSHDFMATTTYNYLNNGKLSLGIGAAIGLGVQRGSIHITDTAGASTNYDNIPFGNKLVGDIRFVEAKVNLANGFGLYGCLGTRSLVAIGVHYTFNNHREY